MLPNPPTEAEDSRAVWLGKLFQNPLSNIGMAAILLFLDFVTGPGIQIALAFIFPVALSAWFSSKRLAYFLAIAQSLIRFGFVLTWNTPYGVDSAIINAFIRIAVLCTIAGFVSRAADQARLLARRTKTLSGILSICLHCKKIEDPQLGWEEIDLYVSRHSDAEFKHCLCPECAGKHYGDILGKA